MLRTCMYVYILNACNHTESVDERLDAETIRGTSGREASIAEKMQADVPLTPHSSDDDNERTDSNRVVQRQSTVIASRDDHVSKPLQRQSSVVITMIRIGLVIRTTVE